MKTRTEKGKDGTWLMRRRDGKAGTVTVTEKGKDGLQCLLLRSFESAGQRVHASPCPGASRVTLSVQVPKHEVSTKSHSFLGQYRYSKYHN